MAPRPAGDAPRRELAGLRVLLLNWRDPRHPQAGGAEQFGYQIARRWVAAGSDVTWLTARPGGQSDRELLDGIRIRRAGGDLSLYLHTAARLLRSRDEFDVIVDCQNGIPFFSPLFARSGLPIVQVIHHVHQDQFVTRFSRPVAAFGRFLEGPVARHVYGRRAVAVVSPSTRSEVRRRLGFRGPIHIVPNGSVDVPALFGPRDPDPTVALVTRLVPHKRLDLLLYHIRTVVERVPRLRVDIVGDGPERDRLRWLVTDLGLRSCVTIHGYRPDAARDALLSRAWVTTSTSLAEGWGCSVIEAAAWGLPCVAIDGPGIRDSVLDGRTGRLVRAGDDFGAVLTDTLAALADEDQARAYAAACRSWAGRFSWDRSAGLLAGIVLGEVRRAEAGRRLERRFARSDIAAVAAVAGVAPPGLRAGLRSTDEVVEIGGRVSILLGGCDEADAVGVLDRLGVRDAPICLATAEDLLAGPDAVQALVEAIPAARAESQ